MNAYIRLGAAGIAAIALACACDRGGAVAPPEATAAPASADAVHRVVLATYPAGSDRTLLYELAIEPCVRDGCPVVMRLTKSGAALDSATLAIRGASQDSSREEVDPGWGAGDPLTGIPGAKAFVTGEESRYLSTLARSVLLSPRRTAVLVTQRAGWEHVKHSHELFVNDGSRIRRVWSASEHAGPTWSSTFTAPRADRTDEVLHVSAFQSDSGGEADALSVSTIKWDERTQTAAEAPAPDTVPLRVVLFGTYRSVAAARAARDAMSQCVLPMLWVVSRRDYPRIPGSFALATLASSQDRPEAALSAGKNCSQRVKISVLPYRNSRVPSSCPDLAAWSRLGGRERRSPSR